MAKLADMMGPTSCGGVFKVLGRLVDAGYLERSNRRIAPTKKFFALTLLGTVPPGLPQPADQDEGYEVVSVEDSLVDHPERTSFCRVKGDSMRDAGLLDDDVVVVQGNSPTKPGDIVSAVVDNQLTVKYLGTDKTTGRRLEPANPAYDVIKPAGSIDVLGVVVGSFRRFDRR